MADEKTKGLTYSAAGVDIEAGDRAVDMIKSIVRSTFTPGVVSDIGGFGGLFSLKGLDMQEPVLVSGTDGVGTKLKLAFVLNKHDTVGIDAVAMCVNDIICSGARPLFFLDYIACGKLKPDVVKDIVSGIADGCRQSGCALVGGEMAEMPGFYPVDEYDIAGFCVGVVDRPKIIDGKRIQSGNVLLALPSSGVHSNGFSLVRKVVEHAGLDFKAEVPELGGRLGDALLIPTKIYAKEVGRLVSAYSINGIAHITGGGLEGNVSRIIPDGLALDIDWSAWKRPAVFDFLQKAGGISEEEMRRVFNLGIGLVIILPADEAEKVMAGEGGGMLRIGKVIKR